MEKSAETLYTLDVPAGYSEDDRLDVYITRFLANATRAKVQRGIREGRVRVNGVVVNKGSHRVQAGDTIVCRLNRPPPIEAMPEDIPLDIVYEDDYLIVVNKAAGMVVHPAYGNRTGTLVNALLHHLGSPGLQYDPKQPDVDDSIGLSTINAAPQAIEGLDLRPGIVHRLDKETSGLLVVAKDDVTHARLARQFSQRTTRRQYEALAWGIPDPPEGRIDTFLSRDPRDRKKMAVVAEGAGKRAITNFRLIEAFSFTSHLAFRLETGRTHQIRIHAAHIGHPILNDAVYGGDRIRYGPRTARRKTFYARLFKHLSRQALHAKTLGFRHPHTGEELDFTSPLPEDMSGALLELRRGVEGML